MRNAIDRVTRDKDRVGVFLSGGLDSTIIAAFSRDTDKEIITYTFGHKDCKLERETARAISDLLGLENIFYEIEPGFIEDFSKKIVSRGDGLIRIRECHFISCLEEIRDITDTVLVGTFGDRFRFRLIDFYRRKFLSWIKGNRDFKARLFSWRSKNLPLDEYDSLFKKGYRLKAKKVTIEGFNGIFDTILWFSPENEMEARAIWVNILSHHKGLAQNFQYMNWYVETRHPFYDYDLSEFALRLPDTLKYQNRFLRKAMTRFYPELSRIPLEHGASFGSNPLAMELQLFMLNMKKGVHPSLTGDGGKDNRLDYRDYANWIRTESKNIVLESLSNDPKICKYVRRSYIKKILDEHMKEKKDHNELILDLLNIELLLQMYDLS